MGCRRPQILELPYMLTGVPSNQTDRYVLANFGGGEDGFIAAVEIDCSSEVDCCIISDSGGRSAFVCVGSPAIGPFQAPVLVRPWRRVMPFSNDGQGYNATPLILFPPKLSLKFHWDMPPWFQARRAPVHRTADDSAVLGAGYSVVAEFPLFGFKSARILLTNGGSTSLTYRVMGKQYRPKDAKAGQADDPVGWDASAVSSALALNGSGSTELTLATLVTTSVTFVDEPWDTLQLEAKFSSVSGAVASNPYYQASGEP